MSDKASIQLSIITPCYNPIAEWDKNYIESCKSIKKLLDSICIEWILVNDGSTEGVNKNIVQKIKQEVSNFHYISYKKNKGKGYAIRQGVRVAKAPKLIFTDIDFPYKNHHIKEFYEQLNEFNDIIIGTRKQHYYKHISPNRAWVSKQFRKIVKFLFNIPTTDTQAGIKGFNLNGKEILLNTRINRYLFDLEMIKLAAREKLHIVELNVELKPNIVMPNMKTRVLITEIFNLVKIFFR